MNAGCGEHNGEFRLPAINDTLYAMAFCIAIVMYFILGSFGFDSNSLQTIINQRNITSHEQKETRLALQYFSLSTKEYYNFLMVFN